MLPAGGKALGSSPEGTVLGHLGNNSKSTYRLLWAAGSALQVLGPLFMTLGFKPVLQYVGGMISVLQMRQLRLGNVLRLDQGFTSKWQRWALNKIKESPCSFPPDPIPQDLSLLWGRSEMCVCIYVTSWE